VADPGALIRLSRIAFLEARFCLKISLAGLAWQISRKKPGIAPYLRIFASTVFSLSLLMAIPYMDRVGLTAEIAGPNV
jgi:hypothetical protein